MEGRTNSLISKEGMSCEWPSDVGWTNRLAPDRHLSTLSICVPIVEDMLSVVREPGVDLFRVLNGRHTVGSYRIGSSGSAVSMLCDDGTRFRDEWEYLRYTDELTISDIATRSEVLGKLSLNSFNQCLELIFE